MYKIIVALVVLAAPTMATSKATSTSKRMPFEQCLATIRSVSSSLGVAPINIVETNIIRLVRFRTEDGSVLITCSRPDQKMIITQSTNRG